MKLNNKGFAITAVLYGLLILFVILVSSYLVVLSAKKDRVENIVNDIEGDYNISINQVVQKNFDSPFYVNCDTTGTFVFISSSEGKFFECEAELNSSDVIYFADNSIVVNADYLRFSDQECDEVNGNNDIRVIYSLTYKNCNY